MQNLFRRTDIASNALSLFVALYFVAINSLFFYKYGSRHPSFSIWILVFYTFFQIAFLYFVINKKNYLKRFNLRKSYFITCITICISIFAITYLTDANSLNVDRWSAMNVAIKAIFSGEYPYTAVDHMNGRTSNFPGLILIGIPFYLLGNVGYLQVFSFALLSFTFYKCLDIHKALSCILLLSISICFWYEIAVISDFMSNMILILCTIMLWNYYFADNIFRRPILLGVLISILVLTRGFAFIPICLFLFAPFYKASMTNKFKFVISCVLSFSILFLLVLKDCPDIETLKNYNPIILQASYTSTYINAIAIILPIILSFLIKDIYYSFFNFSFFILLGISISSFVVFYNSYGLFEIIHHNKYDLVYLSYLLPFLIIILTRNKGSALGHSQIA